MDTHNGKSKITVNIALFLIIAGNLSLQRPRTFDRSANGYYVKDFFRRCKRIRNFPTDMFTFTKEIFNGKFHLLCRIYIPNFRNILVLLEKLLIIINTQSAYV